ncbi:MAG: glycosyltransferase family 4 protein [Bacteroidales bacterium]|nr:glycosyltransferase family 4 protein [Bacteroidales bacterium]
MNKKLRKLLFITAFPPNFKSGGQKFSLNLLRDLSKTFLVDLIYFEYKNHSIESNLPVNLVKSFKVNNLNCFSKITAHPIFTRRFNKSILRYLADVSSRYDILFFDYSQVSLYSMFINHPYKVIRSHDVLFQMFSRKNKIFKYWIKCTEGRIFQSAQKVFVLSKKDADLIENIYNLKVYFSHECLQEFHFFEFSRQTKIFLFFGLWSRKENLDGLLWFVKEVLPLINRSLDIKFMVIGGGLPERIKKKYLEPNNIDCLGFVDRPLDIIYTSCAVIAPLFTGAGVKVKVIDAFTTGTPVIGTDITFEGLPFSERLVYHAEKPLEYAGIIHNFPVLTHLEKQKNADVFRQLYNINHLSDQL